MQKIRWNDRVRYEEILRRIKQRRISLQTIKSRNDNRVPRILCMNCLLKHVIEGKIEGRILVAGRRRGRSKQLLNDLEEPESTGSLKRKH